MMNYRVLVPFVFAAALVSTSLSAQKQDEKRLSEKEVERLAKSLGDWESLIGQRGRSAEKKALAAQEKFLGEYEKIAKDREGDGSILAMVSSWGEVFRAASFPDRKRSPDGKGRIRSGVKTEGVWDNEPVSYEYAIRIPSNYSSKDSWPLIISLHERGNDADDHLKETWEDAVPKDLLDQFVIICPAIGERTAGDVKKAKRIEWFNDYHLWNIFWPLRQVLEDFNIDTDRVYLDGTGYGGATAMHLAMLRAKQFAGVSVRNGTSKRLEFLENLSATPMHVFGREAWIGTDEGSLAKGRIAAAKLSGLPVDLASFPAATGRSKLKGLDSIPEASETIAKFFLENTRKAYPRKLAFSTDHLRFKQSEWLWLETFDLDEKENLFPSVLATVDAEKNQIDITTKNVEKFKVLVSDGFLDLDRPIKIMLNGKPEAEQKIGRSLDSVLDWHRQNPFDPTVIMAGAINLSVKPVVEEKKEDGEPASGEAKK